MRHWRWLVAVAPGIVACGSPPEGGPVSPPHVEEPVASPSLFANLDFEEVDAAGVPLHWICYCGSKETACRTSAGDAKHGARALLLSPGCAATQRTKAFDPTKEAHFTTSVRGVVYPSDVRLVATTGKGNLQLEEAMAPITEPFAKPKDTWTTSRQAGCPALRRSVAARARVRPRARGVESRFGDVDVRPLAFGGALGDKAKSAGCDDPGGRARDGRGARKRLSGQHMLETR